MTKKQTFKKKKGVFFILKLLGVSFLCFVFISLVLLIYFIRDLPRPEVFTEKPIILSTRIYDRTGKVLLHEIYGDEKRVIVSLDDIPPHLIYAILAAEDNRFFKHFGIDFQGIIRAALTNIRRGRIVQGGSTLTQQLARTAFLGKERTFERKIEEIILTLELERRYSKNQILEWYLNHIPLGINHGVGAASQAIFNKPASELSLAESAILASLIRAPSRLSPFGPNKDELLYIKDRILEEMVRENFITAEEAKEAKEEELIFSTSHRQGLKAPHFSLEIKYRLIDKYGENFLRESGLRIITSLDWELQRLAEQIIQERLKINKANNAHNTALVAIDPTTGHILALVGSTDWFENPYPIGCIPGRNCLLDPKFNAATNTGRQPGSTLKPFIFAAAFEKHGFNEEIIIDDVETNFGIWGGQPFIPQNFDQRFRGAVTLRQTLAQSLNIPTIKILRDLVGLGSFQTGIESSVELIKNLGLTTFQQPLLFYGPSFALGVHDIHLIDITSAYGVFATEGLRVPPVNILRIEDRQGNIIEENNKRAKRVLSKQTSQAINSILSDREARAPIFGTSLNLRTNEVYSVAVKTGTSDKFRDRWAIGYTFGETLNQDPLVVGVWVGNSNNSPTGEGALAASIWRIFMERALFLN